MDLHTAVGLYNRAWGETDESVRRDLLVRAWAHDGVYTDPTTVAQGREELIALMGAVQQQFSGMRIELSSPVEQHHDAFMFTWDLCMGDVVAISGRDFGIHDANGRISDLTCFYALPAEEPGEITVASA